MSARSQKLPCKNIVKSVMITITLTVCYEIMIINTSARPMCKAYQKAGYATDEPLTEKKS